jgi:hypothetical protein
VELSQEEDMQVIDQDQVVPASRVHPHPIRWDADLQLWVCTQGCGFTRPKREGEVVPSREEAHAEARRAGTGADFADLPGRTTRTGQGSQPGQAPGPDGAPSGAPPGASGTSGAPAGGGREGEGDNEGSAEASEEGA